MGRRRKLPRSGTSQAALPQDGASVRPEAETLSQPPPRRSKRRKVKAGGDPRVMQFREEIARARVRGALKWHPELEATAFTHRPWLRGSGLMAMEAQRVLSGRSIEVAGICYTHTKRAVCDECTYERHAQLKTEGWNQPIFEGGDGMFECFECGTEFVGDLEKWPR